jgi:hypothetical protein
MISEGESLLSILSDLFGSGAWRLTLVCCRARSAGSARVAS